MKEVTNTINIKATASRVWDLLVNPEETCKYMHGCRTESEWQTGSQLSWKMDYEGKEIIPVQGKIVEIVPNVKLHYTVIDPAADYPLSDINHLQVVYSLLQHEEETTFTVCQFGFENAADGDKRYESVYNNGSGWQPLLVEIKRLAEQIS